MGDHFKLATIDTTKTKQLTVKFIGEGNSSFQIYENFPIRQPILKFITEIPANYETYEFYVKC